VSDTFQAPPVPADCDLRDFQFMPLHVVRLRSSEQNSDVMPEANWAALQLWCAAWHEVPASSIPDNDQWQAKAAGYVSRGTIDARWGDIKAGALRKFYKASDGRLYHPIVAEEALKSWASKLMQRWRSECGRVKKHNQRNNMALPTLSYEAWLAAGRPQGQPLPVPGDVPGDKGSKRQGQGQGQGHHKEIPKVSPVAASAEAPAPKPRGVKRVPASFEVSAEMVLWAAESAPDVDWKRQTERMRDWEYKHPRTDWAAAWRTWMRKAQEEHDQGRSRQGAPTQRAQRAMDALSPALRATLKTPGQLAPAGEVIEGETRVLTR
jgi:hypothetical protein